MITNNAKRKMDMLKNTRYRENEKDETYNQTGIKIICDLRGKGSWVSYSLLKMKTMFLFLVLNNIHACKENIRTHTLLHIDYDISNTGVSSYLLIIFRDLYLLVTFSNLTVFDTIERYWQYYASHMIYVKHSTSIFFSFTLYTCSCFAWNKVDISYFVTHILLPNIIYRIPAKIYFFQLILSKRKSQVTKYHQKK